MRKDSIGYDADQYKRTKLLPFRVHVEDYTIFDLLGDIKGQRGFDVGCGTGLYARKMIKLGASHVTGLDLDARMIALARKRSREFGDSITYVKENIEDSIGKEDCDFALGSYVLSYSRTLEEAAEYFRRIFTHLKPGGRFIGFGNNPFDAFFGSRYKEYGIEKIMEGDVEGSPVIYRIHDNDVGGKLVATATNYHLHAATYREASREAGIRQFSLEPVQLDPNPVKIHPITGRILPDEYYDNFFGGLPRFKSPFIAMVAVK